MNEEQSKQWKDYGCLSRCLIYLANGMGNPITAEEYCEKFEHLFPRPKDRYGILDDASFRKIASELGFTVLGFQGDLAKLGEILKRGGKVLAMSKVDINPGQNGEVNHCSVLTSVGADGFSIWTPYQNGMDGELDFANAVWGEKKFVGCVMR